MSPHLPASNSRWGSFMTHSDPTIQNFESFIPANEPLCPMLESLHTIPRTSQFDTRL